MTSCPHAVQEKVTADTNILGKALQMWVAQKYIEHPLIINRR